MLENILGREIVAKVTDFNDKYIFAQVDGLTFRMARDELLKAPKVNSSLKGFAYINDNHQLQLTKKVPKVQVTDMLGERLSAAVRTWVYLLILVYLIRIL